ncbi:hypothetical protein NMG60_11028884 [Bertholletia excelsa]
MDSSQWSQEVGLANPIEEKASSSASSKPMMLERKVRPQKDQALNCPRCNSTNTKFCYYNNYSLTQPRYFCRTCRRYWTQGGSLRNVPVGGGSRKNKRSSISSTSSHKLLDLNPQTLSSSISAQNPNTHQGKDLNLAFPIHNTSSSSSSSFPLSLSTSSHLSTLELLKSEIASRGLSSFISPLMESPNNVIYNISSGFGLQDVKPNLGFSVDGSGTRYNGNAQENGGRLMFPFGGGKQPSSAGSNDQVDQNKGQGINCAVYWNGMLGGGSW